MVGGVEHAVVGDVDVLEAVDRDRGEADAAADIRRDAVIGAEIDIGVREPDPALDVGRVFVGAWIEIAWDIRVDTIEAIATGISVLTKEGRIAAIFAGDVETQPAVELVADAPADKRRALDVLVKDLKVVELEKFARDVADHRIGAADEASEVPRARATDARSGCVQRGRRQMPKIGGMGRRTLAENQSKCDDD